MKETIVRFLRIPEELRESYWQDTVQRNRISLLVINIMIIGMELFNMLRVLFWSRSGLGTLNNRIYFTLYCTLWLAAVLSIVLQRLVRRRQWAVQYGTVLFALIWHVCMNAYDLMRSPEAEISIYMTAILGLAVFIQMPSGYSFFSYGAAYALFMGLAGRILDTGDIINLTIMTIVALAVSLTSSRHAVIRLEQSREISEINQQLQALLQKDPLTGLLNKVAFEGRVRAYLAQEPAALTLLIVDLDDFKDINDKYGHPCGDHVLRETAACLRDAFARADGVGRIGGDEFAAVLFGSSERRAIEQYGETLGQALSRISWQGAPLGVRCSIGACRADSSAADYAQLYREADDALYEAKRLGKGRLHWSRPESGG